MKKRFAFTLIAVFAMFLFSCTDNSVEPVEENGEIALYSTPSGAQIIIDGTVKGTTPDTVTTKVGMTNIMFHLTNYVDTTITIGVSSDNLEVLSVTLTPVRIKYGLIKVWETGNNSTTDEPSGIDLSAGNPISISGADSLLADIYYTGSNFTIRSASYLGDNFRVTEFKEGTTTNIDDGLDSPAHDGNWLRSMPDEVNGNYYFLYDADGNYSKFKVVNTGGTATWNDPKWVEVEWIYVKAPGVTSF